MSTRLPRHGAIEKEDRIDEMKKKHTKTQPLLQAQQDFVLLYAKVVGCPALEATKHHHPTQPPTHAKMILNKEFCMNRIKAY